MVVIEFSLCASARWDHSILDFRFMYGTKSIHPPEILPDDKFFHRRMMGVVHRDQPHLETVLAGQSAHLSALSYVSRKSPAIVSHAANRRSWSSSQYL